MLALSPILNPPLPSAKLSALWFVIPEKAYR
jgi:hypothetical protein